MINKLTTSGIISLGTGAQIASELLRKKAHYSLLPRELPRRKSALGIMQILNIDIDGKSPQSPPCGNKEIDAITFTPAEKLRLELPDHQDIKEVVLKGHDDFEIPLPILDLFEAESGARGFRWVTRAYVKKNKSIIEGKIAKMLFSIRRNIDSAIREVGNVSSEDIHLWIVFFTGGGMGSGAIAEICRIIRRVVRKNNILNVVISLAGILPGAEISVDSQRTQANAYSVIKELYGSILQGENLFNHLYLIEGVNAENNNISFENIYFMIANLLCVLHASPAGDLFYGRLADAENKIFMPDNKYGMIRCVSSFGHSKVFLPDLLDLNKHRLARSIFCKRLKEPEEDIIPRLVDNFMVNAGLNTEE